MGGSIGPAGAGDLDGRTTGVVSGGSGPGAALGVSMGARAGTSDPFRGAAGAVATVGGIGGSTSGGGGGFGGGAGALESAGATALSLAYASRTGATRASSAGLPLTGGATDGSGRDGPETIFVRSAGGRPVSGAGEGRAAAAGRTAPSANFVAGAGLTPGLSMGGAARNGSPTSGAGSSLITEPSPSWNGEGFVGFHPTGS